MNLFFTFFLWNDIRTVGEIEGCLGVIRYCGVLPRYHGLCIGRRYCIDLFMHIIPILITKLLLFSYWWNLHLVLVSKDLRRDCFHIFKFNLMKYFLLYRLLDRVENTMEKMGCVRCMACIPDPRSMMINWIERRG